MKKNSITVGVTGLNNIDSPGPGIPVIRALKGSLDFDVRIVGLSYETLEPGIYMHELVDKVYQLPLPTAGTSMLKDRLSYIQNYEKLDVIIPNFDAELHNFIKIAQWMKEELGIATFLPSMESFEERQKSELNKFGEKQGIKVPASRMVSQIQELKKLEEEIDYPMVIKGRYYDAYIASSFEQATSYFYKIVAKWGYPVIVQEFITGTEVNVTALGDGKGTCIGAVPMRKLYITDKGKAWSGISLEDEKLLEISRDIVEKSHWRGGCELEFIKTKKEEYYLIEMNPRFPAWVYLANGCGQNHAEALVKMALGEEVKPFTRYKSGKMFIRYSYDMIVDISEFEKISTTGEK
ncbi:MAG: ATP-grasp domain-containing protein [Fermentimonas sp.]|nr:ATP-grasp domain-containing protein [Fermentimonas sp.]MDD3188959.1 ATP-grasp domain-containing protein [Fermentimonas sp.]MDD4283404.1 ATP-grasp domain-containing protein [Fermentimonas sp.]MDD4724100.1 ATP-grasp domain-containing protein [Fermentimonas sp.]